MNRKTPLTCSGWYCRKEVSHQLDFGTLASNMETYISDELANAASDLVFKIHTKQEKPTDIYFLFEHKAQKESTTLFQLLKYKYLKWEEDKNEGKPFRTIVAIVLYHGKAKWDIPTEWAAQFDVNEQFKEYLLNFKYVFFNLNDWDLSLPENKAIKDNVYLLSGLLLLKAAFNQNIHSVENAFKLWGEHGLAEQPEQIVYFLRYVSATKKTPMKNVGELLEKHKIKSKQIMETLADVLKAEGREEGRELERTLTKKAISMIKAGADNKTIAAETQMPEKEIIDLRAIIEK